MPQIAVRQRVAIGMTLSSMILLSAIETRSAGYPSSQSNFKNETASSLRRRRLDRVDPIGTEAEDIEELSRRADQDIARFCSIATAANESVSARAAVE